MWSLLKAFPFPVSLSPHQRRGTRRFCSTTFGNESADGERTIGIIKPGPTAIPKDKKETEKKKKQHSYPVNWTAFIFKNSTYPLWVGERKGLLSPSKLWKENTAASARFLSCSTSIAPKLSEGVPGSWRCKINWNLVHEKTKCSPYSFITIYFAFF